MSGLVLTKVLAIGETWEWSLTLLDDDGTATDLTGATASCSLRASRDPNSAAIWTKTQAVAATQIELVAPTTGGILKIKGIASDTASLIVAQRYYFDCWVTTSGGRELQIVDSDSTLTLTDTLKE